MNRGERQRPAASQRRPASSRPRSASRPPHTRRPQSSTVDAPARRARLTAFAAHSPNVRRAQYAVVAIVVMIILAPTVRAYFGQRSEITSLREQVAAQNQTVKDLQLEQARWQDPVYVERQARTQLKFVKVGEKAYTVLDPDPSAPPAVVRDVALNPSGASDQTWFDAVWGSMKIADVPANPR